MDFIGWIADMLRGRRLGASVSIRFGGPDEEEARRPCVRCGRMRRDHAGIDHRFESHQPRPRGG